MFMERSYSFNIFEILRGTLRRLEEDAEFRQDEPAVVQLKKHILQSLAELESIKDSQYCSEIESPIPVSRFH